MNIFRTHLTASDEPLKEGTTLFVNCGMDVPNAAFVMSLDTEALENVMDWGTFRNGCYKCLKVPLVGRYQYAVVNGQERMTEEANGN